MKKTIYSNFCIIFQYLKFYFKNIIERFENNQINSKKYNITIKRNKNNKKGLF